MAPNFGDKRNLEWLAGPLGTVAPGCGESQDGVTGVSPLLLTNHYGVPGVCTDTAGATTDYGALLPAK